MVFIISYIIMIGIVLNIRAFLVDSSFKTSLLNEDIIYREDRFLKEILSDREKSLKKINNSMSKAEDLESKLTALIDKLQDKKLIFNSK